MMHITNSKSIQPVYWLATAVTDALAWSMAFTLWLAPQLSSTRTTTSDPQVKSPAERHGTSSSFADDERFRHGYFGRYR